MREEPVTRAERVRAAVGIAALVLVFCSPMLLHPEGLRQGDSYRDEDWLHDLSFSLYLREALLEYGEFPLRTHLVGGGFPILGHPGDGSLSPLTLPFLVLPVGVAVRFNLVLLLWLGALGTWGLARRELGLASGPALLAGAAFAFAGWLPSLMLAGFYTQAMCLPAPLALHVLLGPGDGLRRGLLAGLLLLPLLLQGGPALLAVLHFVAVAAVVVGCARARGPGTEARRSALALVAVAVLSAALSAPAAWLGAAPRVGLAIAAGTLAWGRSETLRGLARDAAPYLVRVGVAVALLLSVGAAKWTSVLEVTGAGTDFFAVGADEEAGYPFEGDDGYRSFYGSVPSFLGHLHRPLARTTTYAEPYAPDTEEYGPLGLTAPVAAAFLLAAVLALRRGRGGEAGSPAPRFAPWVGLAALYVALCFGPNLPGDPYRLLVWGLPGFEVISDPYKYFDLFVVVPVVLGFGVLSASVAARWGRRALLAPAVLLAWPLLMNAPLWATLFALPAEPGDRVEDFEQVALARPPAADTYPHPEMYREIGRPDAAREFFTVPRGVGLINWYADLYGPEYAVPRWIVAGDGSRRPNPDWRGEAWCEGACELRAAAFTMNTATARVYAGGPSRVVFNQNHAAGFRSDAGDVVSARGYLAVDVAARGAVDVSVRYRPPRLLAALAASLASALLVLGLLVVGRGRELGARHLDP